MKDDLWQLILLPFYWLFLTVLIKQTKEKWLLALHEQKYVEYCRRVDHCISYSAQGTGWCSTAIPFIPGLSPG